MKSQQIYQTLMRKILQNISWCSRENFFVKFTYRLTVKINKFKGKNKRLNELLKFKVKDITIG